MSNDERQIHVIVEYLSCIPEPQPGWPEGYIADNSYARWAVEFMLASVLAEPDKTPARVVMEFEELMEKYSKMATSDHYGRDIAEIWDIAWREAMNLSDILRAMG